MEAEVRDGVEWVYKGYEGGPWENGADEDYGWGPRGKIVRAGQRARADVDFKGEFLDQIRRMWILSALGTPTELLGLSDEGVLWVKQPKVRIPAEVRAEEGKGFDSEWQGKQQAAWAKEMKRIGMITVSRWKVVSVDGIGYVVTDVNEFQNVGMTEPPDKSRMAMFDPVVTEISKEALKWDRDLRDGLELAQELERRLAARRTESLFASTARHAGASIQSPAPAVTNHDALRAPVPGENDEHHSQTKIGKTLLEVVDLLPEERASVALAPTALANAELSKNAAQTVKEWPEIITAADGGKVEAKRGDRGDSMGSRVFHLIRDEETNRLDFEKIAWMPRVPETLQQAQLRLVDDRDGTRVFVRKYDGGTLHMVVVKPDGRVIAQQPIPGGHFVTQFPKQSLARSRQRYLRIDWEAR